MRIITAYARSCMMVIAVALLMVIALTGAAYAAGGGGHAVDSSVLLKDFLYRLLNFTIVFVALYYLLAKRFRQGMADRRAKLKESLEQAEKARKTAEAKLAEYERKLSNSDQEVAELLAQAKEANSRERSKVLGDAKAAADTVRKEARLCAEREIERARRELRAEAAQMAVSMAEDILRKGITDEDRARLVTENLQKMESQS